MSVISIIVKGIVAGSINIYAECYRCEVVDMSMLGGGMVEVSITGNIDDINNLLEYIRDVYEEVILKKNK